MKVVGLYDRCVVEQPTTHGVDVLATLSPREKQVLEMATLGLTNDEVAKKLAVTVHAVKFHLAAVYRKLGVSNRTEAAVLYLQASTGTPRRPLELSDVSSEGS